MSSPYPEAVRKAVSLLCEELSHHYPEIFKMKFDSFGKPESDGCSFKERMEMGVYLELIKAGVIK